jgi:hypothetical protein
MAETVGRRAISMRAGPRAAILSAHRRARRGVESSGAPMID